MVARSTQVNFIPQQVTRGTQVQEVVETLSRGTQVQEAGFINVDSNTVTNSATEHNAIELDELLEDTLTKMDTIAQKLGYQLTTGPCSLNLCVGGACDGISRVVMQFVRDMMKERGDHIPSKKS